MNKIIEVTHFTKDYGYNRGVFDISFEVFEGEAFGFLGPNGAGKTTTIRHLLGFSKPDSGETKILGVNTRENYHEINQDIGYIPGEIAFPEALTGSELISMIKGLHKQHDKSRLEELLDIFELDPSPLIKHMTLGTKRKLAIVIAFMHDPKILILDEPTSGLDILMQRRFLDFIKNEKKRGKTIFLSSHIFSEVDETCDRVAIIKDGRIVSLIETSSIQHNSNKTYQMEFITESDYQEVKNGPFSVQRYDDGKLQVKLAIDDSKINELIEFVKNRKMKYFKENKFTLEDYFMKYYITEREFGDIK